jgi:hypothetical protein
VKEVFYFSLSISLSLSLSLSVSLSAQAAGQEQLSRTVMSHIDRTVFDPKAQEVRQSSYLSLVCVRACVRACGVYRLTISRRLSLRQVQCLNLVRVSSYRSEHGLSDFFEKDLFGMEISHYPFDHSDPLVCIWFLPSQFSLSLSLSLSDYVRLSESLTNRYAKRRAADPLDTEPHSSRI